MSNIFSILPGSGGGGGGDATAANQNIQIGIESDTLSNIEAINVGNGTTNFGINGAQGSNFLLDRIRNNTNGIGASLNSIDADTTTLASTVFVNTITNEKFLSILPSVRVVPLSTGATFTAPNGYCFVLSIMNTAYVPISIAGAFGATSGLTNPEFMSIQQSFALKYCPYTNWSPQTLLVNSNPKSLGPALVDMYILYMI